MLKHRKTINPLPAPKKYLYLFTELRKGKETRKRKFQNRSSVRAQVQWVVGPAGVLPSLVVTSWVREQFSPSLSTCPLWVLATGPNDFSSLGQPCRPAWAFIVQNFIIAKNFLLGGLAPFTVWSFIIRDHNVEGVVNLVIFKDVILEVRDSHMLTSIGQGFSPLSMRSNIGWCQLPSPRPKLYPRKYIYTVFKAGQNKDITTY